VFLDRRGRRWADEDPQDDIVLHAAMTSNYMWCVMSVDFATTFYPIRELMIGYARQTSLETREEYHLIIDCLEKQADRVPWMGRILDEIQALKMGGRNVAFPTMYQRGFVRSLSQTRKFIVRCTARTVTAG
jgi:hypothetical protein